MAIPIPIPNPQSRTDDLSFDSSYEGGNLDLVIQVSELEYDLFMRVDSNTRGHLQWFNFKIHNLKCYQRIKLNIVNFTKKDSLYLRSLKPYIRSEQAGTGWR